MQIGVKLTLPCIKENGTKYYKNGNEVFSVLNGKKQVQIGFDQSKFTNNQSARNYFKEADNLREYIQGTPLKDLKTSNIVNPDTGDLYAGEDSPYYSIEGDGIDGKIIFDFNNSNGIESETSNFNTHRIDVIKNAIERNLSVSIANFNIYSTEVPAEFQMPKLKDEDWDKIMNNIAVISFFQGANIGGKIYNGYSVIANTMNEDVVMEDSIYIKSGDNICDITQDGLSAENAVGIFNINTEPRTASNGTTYFIPVTGTLSYDSIITRNNISDDFKGNLKVYVKNIISPDLRKVYYTALARERYGLYRPKLEM